MPDYLPHPIQADIGIRVETFPPDDSAVRCQNHPEALFEWIIFRNKLGQQGIARRTHDWYKMLIHKPLHRLVFHEVA